MKDYIKQFFDTFKDLIKHPKKLIPTFVLCGMWLVFPMMSAFGLNIPILRFLYTLTYANGGMYGGFFGTIGGIFGKAVFAAFVNTAVLAVANKQKLFAKGTFKRAVGSSAASGLSAITPFVTAGGAGLLLYWFFNITASEQNIAVAVAGALAALSAAGRQSGLLFSIVAGIVNKLSKRSVLNRTVISRALTGLSAGFALGFGLTFIRSSLVLVIAGAALVFIGIIFGIVGGRGTKAVATAMIAMLIIPMLIAGTCFDVQAASFCNPTECAGLAESLSGNNHGAVGSASQVGAQINAARIGFGKAVSNMLNDHIDREMYGCPLTCDNIGSNNLSTTEVVRNGGRSDLTVEGIASCYTNGQKGELIDYSDYLYNISYRFEVEFSGLEFFENKVSATSVSGTEDLSYGLTSPDEPYKNGELINTLSGSKLEGIWYIDGTELYVLFQIPGDKGNLVLYLEVSKVLPADDGSAATQTADFTSDYEESTGNNRSEYAYYEGDEEYVKYRGRLTYTNGAENKWGQPFPDLMDFDGDGDIDFADMAIQKELSHNPDYLDMPGSMGLKVLAAVLAALGGGFGGATAAIAGAAAGTAASGAAGTAGAVADTIGSLNTANPTDDLTGADSQNGSLAEADSPNDLGRYITRDGDGDLNVTDPATGEKRLYTANGDGTYTNPLTGATYTEAELVDSVASRVENADLYAQDAQTAKDAIAQQRAANQGLSEEAKQYAKDKQAAEDNLKREIYEERLAIKYGTDKENLKDAIASKQAKNQASADYYTNRAENMDNVVKGLELTQTVADTGVDVLANMTGGAGQTIKKLYTVGKNTASRLSEAACSDDPNKKDIGAALAMAGFDSLADIGQDMAGNAGFHITSNIGSEVFKNGMQNLYDGKDFFDGAGQKVVTGTAKGLVDKFGAVLNKGQSNITKETLRNDMAFIGHASASGKVSEKGLRALRDMRLMTYLENTHAEQVLSNITTATGDIGKTVIDGVSDAYSDIRDAMKKD